jgi:UDP-GlcNAc3NAcA epimerase
MSDHASTLLFAPTDAALKNLMREGFKPDNSPPYSIDNPKICLTGDIMYDNTLFFSALAEKKASLLDTLGVERDKFILATVHREINTDEIQRLEAILKTLKSLSEEFAVKIVMPLHPRTVISLKTKLADFYSDLLDSRFIKIVPPVSFLEMTLLEKTAKLIITDSGGVQKESHFFRKPCLVLRQETEWIELVKNGTAVLVDADPVKIRNEFIRFYNDTGELNYPGFYGDGRTAEFILNETYMMFENA